MINFEIEEYCEHCAAFEVEQMSYAHYLPGGIATKSHFLKCKHRDKCREIKKYLKSQK